MSKKEGQFEQILTNMQNSTKKKPVVRANKKTWFFDTAAGIDHTTKVLHDFTDIRPEDAVKLNKESKLEMIKEEEKGLKKYDANDVTTYPSDPEQRRKLQNIESLEKSVGVTPDSWKRFVKTGAMPLVPKNFVSATKVWDGIYSSMSPNEKRKFNHEQKTMENKRNFENRQDKIKEFRAKAAIKKDAAGPAKAMAQEVVDSVINNPVIDEVLKRSEARLQPPTDYEPMFNYEPPLQPGLNRVFTQRKLDEADAVREVLDE